MTSESNVNKLETSLIVGKCLNLLLRVNTLHTVVIVCENELNIIGFCGIGESNRNLHPGFRATVIDI